MLKIRVEMNERETKHRKDQQSKIWFTGVIVMGDVRLYLEK